MPVLLDSGDGDHDGNGFRKSGHGRPRHSAQLHVTTLRGWQKQQARHARLATQVIAPAYGSEARRCSVASNRSTSGRVNVGNTVPPPAACKAAANAAAE